MRSRDSDRIDIRTDQYDANLQESTSMVEEGDASQIVHMSIKFKQKNRKKERGNYRQGRLLVMGVVFVVLAVVGLGYLLSKTEGNGGVKKESKDYQIAIKDKKGVDQKAKSEEKNQPHFVNQEKAERGKEELEQIENSKKLNIPNQLQIEKFLWLFQTEQHSNTLRRLYYENNKHFAKVGGYKTVIISKTNSRQYMTPQTKEKYDKVVKIVGQDNNVAINFALVCVLADNGGIMITDYLAITEPMQWVSKLNNDINIRRGRNMPKVQVFGYYDPQASSPNVKQNIEVEFEVQKYVRSFPGLLPYFLLAKKNAAFMKDLIDEVVLMITDPVQSENRAGTNFYGVQQSIEHHYFTMAVHRLLQRRQKILNSQLKPGQKTRLAVDLYGLYYINQLAGVRKIWALFGEGQTHVQYQSLSRMSKQELYSYIGHFKYIGRITPEPAMNGYIEQAINKKRYPIVKGSFVQQVLFPKTEGLDYIIDNPEKFISDPKGKTWDALPKIIWLYWHSGHENAAVSIQLAVQSMKRRAKESNFEVRLVNDNNLKDYLDAQTLGRIQNSLKNARVTVFPPSKSDFVRLALISTHGGIYFDSSYMALTNFDWLVNISRYRSQYIYNRFGQLPKVLVHFHPQWGGVYQWQFNTTVNTKVQWQLPYESNFIAAEKGSQFVKEWFELHLQLFLKPYYEIAKVFDECGLASGYSRWGSQYLIVMDGVKCVVGRKQKELKEKKLLGYSSAVEFYGLWSINGFMGIQKYRDRTGFQTHTNVDNNFAYRYSEEYVQSLIGDNFNLVKFYGAQHNNAVSNFIISNINDLSQQAHPQSLFMKYLIPKNLKLENVGGRWVVKY